MKDLKVRVLENDKGLDEGLILDVINPDLSTDNTYNYAMDNEVNAQDEATDSICIGEKTRHNMYESEDSNWLFEDEYEIIEIDGNKKIECYIEEDLLFTFEYLEYNNTWEAVQTIGGITFNGYKTYEEAKSDMEKRYGVIIDNDNYTVTNEERGK